MIASLDAADKKYILFQNEELTMVEYTDDGIKFPSASQWVRGIGAFIGLTMMILVLKQIRNRQDGG